jgi:peptide subunit release factor 1 (eRF1)
MGTPCSMTASLSALFDEPGPFLSVYLNVEPAVENAAQHDELSWKALRERVQAEDADARALAHVDALVPDAHLHGRALAVIATANGASHIEHFDAPVPSAYARWAALPSIAPLIEAEQARVHGLLVVVDRRGADLFVLEGTTVEDETSVDEDRFPIRKVKPGGWSAPRFQQSAEQNWESEAGEIAAVVDRAVAEHDARAVAVAGDVRMTALLREKLPKGVADLVQIVGTGARREDRSYDDYLAEVTREVATVAASDTVARLEKFKEQRGADNLAVEGAAETLDALARAEIDVLLVHDDPVDSRTAWFGPERTHVAIRSDVLDDLGVPDAREGRLVDVAIRAALGTGAGVRIIPRHGPVRDAIGGLLRWK